jgi:EmrB/QacA subfamily drug resistance transporter
MFTSKVNQPSDPPVFSSTTNLNKVLLLWLVGAAFFMESLDTTILNTAVPTVATALKVAPLSMKSVLASYSLSLAVFIPISGWMADRFGTRRVFASSIGLFTVASLLCGLSSGVRVLVACRILQGCGGAMMVPVGRLTLLRTFAKSELVRAIGFVQIAGLIGPILGPIAGGVIVGYLHWRMIFLVNIPTGLLGLLMVYLHLPDFRKERTPPADIVGMVTFGSGVGLLSYVLEVFGEHTASAGAAAMLLGVSLAFMSGYWLHARRIKFPLLRLDLLCIRTFGIAVAGGYLTRLGIGGVSFLLLLLCQVGLGFTPVQSGLLIAPQAAAAVAMKFATPRILARFGYRAVLISNTLIIGIMLLLFAAIGIHTAAWAIVLMTCFYGAFTSLQFASMNTLAYADIAEGETSMASSIFSMVQQMSISFGITCAGLATEVFIPAGLQFSRGEMIHGIQESFIALGAFTLGSTIIFTKLQSTDGVEISRQGGAAARIRSGELFEPAHPLGNQCGRADAPSPSGRASKPDGPITSASRSGRGLSISDDVAHEAKKGKEETIHEGETRVVERDTVSGRPRHVSGRIGCADSGGLAR